MKIIAVKLNEQLIEMLEDAARQRDITRSQLIRDAIEHYLFDVLKMEPTTTKADPLRLKIIC